MPRVRRSCGQPLRVPEPLDAMAEDSEQIIRHEARSKEFQPAVGDSACIEAITEHIERHVGPVAFVLHVLSALLTLAATFVYQHHGKAPAYWLLYSGMTLFALANGTCEGVINPLVATLYPKEKTHYLNILHAGWPAGLIVGGVLSYLMAERSGQVVVRWEVQWLLFLLPVLIYGIIPASITDVARHATEQLLM